MIKDFVVWCAETSGKLLCWMPLSFKRAVLSRHVFRPTGNYQKLLYYFHSGWLSNLKEPFILPRDIFWAGKDCINATMKLDLSNYVDKRYYFLNENELLIDEVRIGEYETVIDVGVNVGQTVLLTAPYVKNVFGFEPEATVRSRADENLRNLTNVHVYPFALSNEEGEEVLHLCSKDGGHTLDGSFLDGDHRKEAGTITIQAKKYDTFSKEQNIPPPSFIKIDVEGHELEVLKGMEETLKEHKPAVWCETSHNERHTELLEYMNWLGFDCMYANELEQTLQSFMPDYVKKDGVFNIFFEHETSIAEFHEEHDKEQQRLI